VEHGAHFLILYYPTTITQVTLTYVHDFLGEHRLPVLLDVKGGKRVHVALAGTGWM
jgi:hypothetical protein